MTRQASRARRALARPILESLESRVVLDTTGSSSRSVVERLYTDLLGRGADPSGLSFWCRQLETGASRLSVVNSLLGSPEARNRLVLDAYTTYLTRTADPSGLDFYSTALARGTSWETVRNGLVASEEFFRQRGGGTTEGFLNSLYQVALGRTPDPSGSLFFGSLLSPQSTGTARSTVAAAVFGSPEGRTHAVDRLYRNYLRRSGEPSGLAFYSQALADGNDVLHLIPFFTASEEYYLQGSGGGDGGGPDTKPPTVVIVTPTESAAVRGQLTVTGRVTDDRSGVAGLDVRTDDGTFAPVVVESDGAFRFITALALDGSADGSHTLQFLARDGAGNVTALTAVDFTLDTRSPTLATGPTGVLSESVSTLEVRFDETMGTSAFAPTHYTLTSDGGTPFPIATIGRRDTRKAQLNLLSQLRDGEYRLRVTQQVTDQAGNPLISDVEFPFTVRIPFAVRSLSPGDSEEMVSLTRTPIVHFTREVDPATVTPETFRLTAQGQTVPGSVRVSSTGLFATFLPTQPLPSSTAVLVEVDGERIKSPGGIKLDADGNGTPGGQATIEFRTLPITRIPGTNVFGFVYDSYNKNPNGSNRPVVGATIRVDAFPEASAVTDANGRFELRDMPAPEFFVHIDGSTATTAPQGTVYATLGKPFHSIPGQTTQLTMDGRPFDIFLPPMAASDVVQLSPTAATQVGFGPAGLAQLGVLFPNTDPAIWNRLQVTYPAGSAIDASGRPATTATVIPVNPQRLPAPLPPGVDPQLVISIQAPGATSFDVPAPITMPNLENLAPGEKTLIWSFDHAAGRWKVIGTATVSPDGLTAASDPGVGIEAPGWHNLFLGAILFGGGAHHPFEGMEECIEEQKEHLEHELAHHLQPFLVAIAPLKEIYSYLDRDADPDMVGKYSGVFKKVALYGNAALDPKLTPANRFVSFYSLLLEEVYHTLHLPFGTLLPYFELVQQSILGGYTYLTGAFHCVNEYLESLGEPPHTAPAPHNAEISTLQRDFLNKAGTLIATGLRSPAWNQVAHDQMPVLRTFLSKAAETTQKARREGRVTPEMRALLEDTPVPSNIPPEDKERLISTITEIYDIGRGGSLPPEYEELEQDLGNAVAAVQQPLARMRAGGWRTPYDAIFGGVPAGPNGDRRGGIQEVSRQGDQMVAHVKVKKAPLFYQILNLDTGFVSRGRLNRDGLLDELVLPPNTTYQVRYFDSQTSQIAITIIRSGSAGSQIEIPAAVFTTPPPGDGDQDGLVDMVEEIVGTDQRKKDTDGDGLSDLAEIQQGLDPLGGRSFPTGVIATLPLRGEARDIVVSGSSSNAESQIAYLATGSHGLAVVDATDFDNPILLGQLDLPGNATGIDVDPQTGLAVVAANAGGLHFIDIRDPMRPVLRQTFAVSTGGVKIGNGIAYASVGTSLHAFELTSGERIQIVRPGSGLITGLARDGNFLYSVDAGGVLRVFDLVRFQLVPRGSVTLPRGGGPLFVADGVAYAASPAEPGGFSTADVRNPENPTILSGPDVAQGTFVPGGAVVATGSGIAAVVGSVRGGNQFLDLHDVTDPTNTGAFLTRVNLPASPLALTLASGIAYVANGEGGLQVVNYLSFDNLGIPPTVTLASAVVDADPSRTGTQVFEGRPLSLNVGVRDDVQVRNVQLLVGGQVVANTVAAPFTFSLTAPTITSGATALTVQVRATDTGGNSTLSAPLTFEVVADRTPPIFLNSTPEDGGAGFRTQTISLRFDKRLDQTRISLASITLTNLGGDGQSGGGDDSTVALAGVTVVDGQRIIVRTGGPLAFGKYRLQVAAAAIANSAGDAAAADVAVTFHSYDADPSTVVWLSDTDGNWSDPAQWNTGAVPGETDDVLIHRLGANPVVTHATGTSVVRTLQSEEHLRLTGGILTGRGQLDINGPLTVASSGQLKATTTPVQVRGITTFDGGTLAAEGGATLTLPAATSLRVVSGSSGLLSANGAGSTLDLSALTLLRGGEGLSRLRVEASAGGVINLSGVTAIPDGSVNVLADGAGSVIDLSALTSLVNANATFASSLATERGGVLRIDRLTELDQVDLVLKGANPLATRQITRFLRGTLTADGTTPDLSGLTTATAAGLVAINGGVLHLPGVTHYAGISGRGAMTFRATGMGSQLNLPAITTLIGGLGLSKMSVLVEGGGQINLRGVTSVNEGSIQMLAVDAGSVIDLSNVTSLALAGATFATLVEADRGGTIRLASGTLTAGFGVEVVLHPTGTLIMGDLNVLNGGTLRGAGTLAANVALAGSLRPGDVSAFASIRNPGILSITGNLTMTPQATVAMQIDGVLPGTNYDQLRVTGRAALAGSLSIAVGNSFVPTVGSSFDVLEIGERDEVFATISGLTLGNGLRLDPEYLADRLRLTAASP